MTTLLAPAPLANRLKAGRSADLVVIGEPRPITRADRIAARIWGLKLPADAPVEVDPPATNLRDSWPVWTDEERWTIPDPVDTTDHAVRFRPTEAQESERLELIAEDEYRDRLLIDVAMTEHWIAEREAGFEGLHPQCLAEAGLASSYTRFDG